MKKPETQIRVASRVLLLNKNNELLLVANKEKMVWFTPGGRVEADETLEQAAIRETYEETGITIDNLRLVYVRESLDYVNPEKPYHHIMFYFLARTEQSLPDSWQDHDGYVELNKFFSQEELQTEQKFWPPILKDQFWQDLKEDFKNASPYSTYTITHK